MAFEKPSIVSIFDKSVLLILNLFCILCFSPVVFAVTVTELGIVSVRSDTEGNNVEELRTRAIRNVLEIAVIRVSGVIITGEQKDTTRSLESYEADGNEIKEKLKQDSVFHNTIVSRTNAYAKLVEILKEWKEDGQYYVKAKVDVSQDKLQEKMRNAGIYWERVGNPTIHISVSRRVNNRKTGGDNYTLKYMRDTMAKNGISVVTNQQDASYSIPVSLTLSTSHVKQFDTYKTNCSISYEIIDTGVENSIAASRKAAGPEGGFSIEETESKCIKKIVPGIARNMVKRLAHEMNEIWNNGRKYKITVNNVNGRSVTKTASTIRNIFRVTNLSDLKYKKGSMQIDVQYKGLPFEFVDNLIKTFEYEKRELSLVSLEENVIELQFE